MVTQSRSFHTLFIALLMQTTSLNAHAEWSTLIDRLATEGHSRAQLEELFKDVQFDPEPVQSKLTSLFEAKFKATRILNIQKGLHDLDLNPGPIDGLIGPKTRAAIRSFQRDQKIQVNGRASAEVLQLIQHTIHPEITPKPEAEKEPPVYKSMLSEERLAEARDFLQQNSRGLERLDREYGVPAEIAVAILAVETRVGHYLGEKKSFVSLASLASANDLNQVRPMFSNYTLTQERKNWLTVNANRISNWAYRELAALLEYAQKAGVDVGEIPGSIYGAIGVSQFMPSNAVRFGIDGNQDGIVNLFEVDDALSSMGNFMKANGWRAGLVSRSGQARVIYRYNRSRTYVNTVLAIADALNGSEADVN